MFLMKCDKAKETTRMFVNIVLYIFILKFLEVQNKKVAGPNNNMNLLL